MSCIWNVTFQSEVVGLTLPRHLEFKYGNEKEIKITVICSRMESSADRYKSIWEFQCKYITQEEKEIEEAINKVKEAVTSLTNLISYKFNAEFVYLLRTQIYKEGEPEGYKWQIADIPYGKLYVVTEEEIKLIEEDFKDSALLNKLSSKEYKLFKDAISIEDTSSSFIVLYGLLQKILECTHWGRSQGGLDKFIKEKCPNYYKEEEMRESTRLKNNGEPFRKNESKYTWLRNQIGHVHTDTDISKVEYEIKQCYEDFKKIVRSALDKYVINSQSQVEKQRR